MTLAAVLLLGLPGCQHALAGRPEATTAKQPVRLVTVLGVEPARGLMLQQLNLPSSPSVDVLQAMRCNPEALVVADATPQTVHSLAEHAQDLQTFTAQGGWIMLWGLTPDGLEDFNRVVGVSHLMRPFTVESVRLPSRPDPLLRGLLPYDVLMLHGFGIQNAPLRDGRVWSYVLDGHDIAPFASIPPGSYWRPGSVSAPGSDQYPPNLVNGVDDNWQFGFTFPTDTPEHQSWTFAFPRPETITRFSLYPDPIYKIITRLRLSFPGSAAAPIECAVDPTVVARQDFSIPDVHASGVTLTILKTTESAVDVSGIRNVWIGVRRSRAFDQRVVPLLDPGVLNKYPMGRGGIIVNEMRMPDDLAPENRERQLRILGHLVQHLLSPPEEPSPEPARIDTPRAQGETTTVQVDDFLRPDDVDDSDAIMRALYFAVQHQVSLVSLAPREYLCHDAIQIQGAAAITLQGTLNAHHRPATKLLFVIPSRYPGSPNVPSLISGVAFRDLLLRY